MASTTATATTSTTTTTSTTGVSEIFTNIYNKNRWGYRGQKLDKCSGHGSSANSFAPIRKLLTHYVKDNGIKSVVDIGCGYWEFYRDEFANCDYIGIDCVQDCVDFNNENYAGNGLRFMLGDVTDPEFIIPDAQFYIIKDVLQHLSNANVKQVLDQLVQKSNVVILMIQDGQQKGNVDIPNGGYRPLSYKMIPLVDYKPRYICKFGLKELSLVGAGEGDFITKPYRELSKFSLPPLKFINPTRLQESNKSTVLLAILARNKSHVLPYFLQCIDELDYDKSLVSVYINTNNNSDNTSHILETWSKSVEGQKYARIDLVNHEMELDEDNRPHAWTKDRFKCLAQIRDGSLQKALEYQCEYYFVVDCDNFIRPSTLKYLIAENKPIIAPLLHGIPHKHDGYSNFFCKVSESGYMVKSAKYNELIDRKKVGTFKVPVVHCTYLIKSEYIPQLDYTDGSDHHEFIIFSRNARKKGIDQFICNKESFGVLLHPMNDKISFEEECSMFKKYLTDKKIQLKQSYVNLKTIGVQEILVIMDVDNFSNRMNKNYYNFLEYLRDNLDNYRLIITGNGVQGHSRQMPIENIIKSFCNTSNPIVYVCDLRGIHFVSGLAEYTRNITIFDFEDVAGFVSTLLQIIKVNQFDFVLHKCPRSIIQEIVDKCVESKFIKYEHYINPEIFKDWGRTVKKDIDVLCFGAAGWTHYPFRERLFNLLKKNSSKLKVFFLEHPGYGSERTHNVTNETLSKLINRAKMTVVTPSYFDFFLKKYIEVALSNSTLIGNLPSGEDDGLNYEGCIIELSPSMSDEEILNKITEYAGENRDDERKAIAKKAMHIAHKYNTYEVGLDIFNKLLDQMTNESHLLSLSTEPEVVSTEPKVVSTEPKVVSTEELLEVIANKVKMALAKVFKNNGNIKETEVVEEVVEPEKEVVEQEKEVVEPEKDVVEPEKDVVEPEKEVVEPEKEVVEPEKEVVEPEKEVVEPEKEIVELKGGDRYRICLNMIVKNETERLPALLKSVYPHIDYYVILDTGSTDGTPELIKEHMDRYGIKGEIYHSEWVNFGYCRDLALKYATPVAEYVLIIDADEELNVMDLALLSRENITADCCYIAKKIGGVEFYIPALVSVKDNNSIGWKWCGVVHEYLDNTKKRDITRHYVPTDDGVWILSHINGGARSKGISEREKYLRDAKLLEGALRDNPKDSRSQFYLAQSYRDAGLKEEAIEHYRKRLDMGGFYEEVYHSKLSIGGLLIKLDRPFEEFVGILLEAYQDVPTRIESIAYLVEYCRKKDMHQLGYMFGKSAVNIRKTDCLLFIEKVAYDYNLLDNYSVCAYWIGDYEESRRCCQILLDEGKMPVSYKDRIKQNLQFCINSLKSKAK